MYSWKATIHLADCAHCNFGQGLSGRKTPLKAKDNVANGMVNESGARIFKSKDSLEYKLATRNFGWYGPYNDLQEATEAARKVSEEKKSRKIVLRRCWVCSPT